MKKIAITTRYELQRKSILSNLIDIVEATGRQVLLSQKAKDNFEGKASKYETYDFEEKVDLLFVVGGDGTVLRAVRSLKDISTPMFGINAGNLGFLSEVSPDDLNRTCQFLWDGQFTEDFRMVIEIEIFKKGKLIKKFHALNEIAINQSGVARIVELPTYVNNELVAIFRADGLIVATPTGSTAYSLSAGGPIIYPKMEAFILTPIAPHSFTQKPIVITPEKTIKILTSDRNREPVAITIDGQICEHLAPDSEIIVTKHPKKVKFIRLFEENYFKTLREKLGWAEGFNGNS